MVASFESISGVMDGWTDRRPNCFFMSMPVSCTSIKLFNDVQKKEKNSFAPCDHSLEEDL